MEKLYSERRPDDILVEKTSGTYDKRVLNYSIRELSKEEIQALWLEYRDEIIGGDNSIELPTLCEEWFAERHRWQYYQLKFPMGVWSYNDVVQAIIRDKYSQDEMEAITNNMAAINAVFMQTLVTDGIIAATKYLKDSINDANTARFKEMQEWRAMAKRVASEIFNK